MARGFGSDALAQNSGGRQIKINEWIPTWQWVEGRNQDTMTSAKFLGEGSTSEVNGSLFGTDYTLPICHRFAIGESNANVLARLNVIIRLDFKVCDGLSWGLLIRAGHGFSPQKER